MNKKKKLFSKISKTAIGALAGASLVLTPMSAMAGDGHDHDTESGDQACSGEESCSGEGSCSGEHSCSGEESCSGETEG